MDSRKFEQSDIAMAAAAGVFLACFCPPLTELGWTRRPTQFNAGFLLLILTTATSVGLCLGAFRFTTKRRWIYLIALIVSGAKLAIVLQMFRLIGS